MAFQKLGGREQLAAAEYIPVLWINFFTTARESFPCGRDGRAHLGAGHSGSPGVQAPWCRTVESPQLFCCKEITVPVQSPACGRAADCVNEGTFTQSSESSLEIIQLFMSGRASTMLGHPAHLTSQHLCIPSGIFARDLRSISGGTVFPLSLEWQFPD